MTLASTLHELTTLVRSFHPLIVVETVEEERARRLVVAAARTLGLSLLEWSLSTGLHFASDQRGGGNAIANTREPAGVLRHIQSLDREGLFLLKDFSPHLADPVVVRLLREVCQVFTRNGSSVVLTGSSLRLPAEIEPHAVYLPLRVPGREELQEVIEHVLDSVHGRSGAREALAPDTRAALVDALRGLTLNQARQAIAYAVLVDGELTPDDLRIIVERKAKAIQDSGLLEYFPAQDNAFELGGFEALEAWLLRAKQGFSQRAAELNLAPPRGVLLLGVQGCGKSLAAKVIARRWGQPLLKLDASRLYDKYIGESEKNLRRAFELAEAMAPAVLWIDEIEKAFATSGEAAQDGGLSKRLSGSLLTWLQERRAPVFVVATANDVFSLPPELMRKGRFDEIFFVDLPRPDERRAIFEIHLRQRKQDPTRFQLEDLVLASDGMSGAEIEQAVISALYRALHHDVALDDALLLRELDATIPLSHSRREDIERLRTLARSRFVWVSGTAA